HTAQNDAKDAKEALKWGAWELALDASRRALESGYRDEKIDEVELLLVQVKAHAALADLPKANLILQSLAQRTDLRTYEGSVRLWEGDILLSRSMRHTENALKLVREARDKGIKDPAEMAYAEGLLANTSNKAVDHLKDALGKDPLHLRANAVLAMFLTCLGQLDEAGERVRFAEAFFPKSPDLKVLHALICALQDQEEAAKEYLADTKSLLSKPQYATAQSIVELISSLRRLDMAIARKENELLLGLKCAVFISKALELNRSTDQSMTSDMLVFPIPPLLFTAFASDPQGLLNLGPLEVVTIASRIITRGEVDDRLVKAFSAAEVIPDATSLFLRATALKDQNRLAEAEAVLAEASNAPSLLRCSRLYALHGAARCEWELSNRKPPQPKMKEKATENLRKLVRELLMLQGISPSWGNSLADLALALEEFDLARWILREWEKQAPHDREMLL